MNKHDRKSSVMLPVLNLERLKIASILGPEGSLEIICYYSLNVFHISLEDPTF